MYHPTIQTQLAQSLAQTQKLLQAQPQDPNAWVRCGMAQFKLGQITDSIQSFDRAEQWAPQITPYLWQRGLSYYYAEQFEAGVRQFEVDLTVNRQDVEETVWRLLCQTRSQGWAVAQADLRPVSHDPRPFMESIYRFYAGKLSAEALLALGTRSGEAGRFYTHLYLGLYHEVTGETAAAQNHITIAAERYPQNDYMWYLACVHRYLRQW